MCALRAQPPFWEEVECPPGKAAWGRAAPVPADPGREAAGSGHTTAFLLPVPQRARQVSCVPGPVWAVGQ